MLHLQEGLGHVLYQQEGIILYLQEGLGHVLYLQEGIMLYLQKGLGHVLYLQEGIMLYLQEGLGHVLYLQEGIMLYLQKGLGHVLYLQEGIMLYPAGYRLGNLFCLSTHFMQWSVYITLLSARALRNCLSVMQSVACYHELFPTLVGPCP
jgi:hypothetical protein